MRQRRYFASVVASAVLTVGFGDPSAAARQEFAQGLKDRLSRPEQRAAYLEQPIVPLGRASVPLSVTVNCAAGQTVTAALARVANLTGPVRITLTGVCTEAVRIAQDDITLVGASAGDGLAATSPASDVLVLDAARRIVLNNLSIRGGAAGLVAVSAASFSASNLHVTGAATGISVQTNSRGLVTSARVEDCGAGLRATTGGVLAVRGGVIDNISGFGANASDGGFLSMAGGALVRNSAAIGVFAANGGSVSLRDATVEGSDTGVQINEGGSARLDVGTLIHNNLRIGLAVHGAAVNLSAGARVANNVGVGIGLFNGARVAFNGAVVENTSGSPGWGVLLTGGASVRAGPGGVTIQGNSSDGISLRDTSVAGFDGATSVILNNGGWGIFCSSAPAVAQISGLPPTVTGNAAGQINCPGIVIP
jgi:hypothetical protein